MLEHLAGDLVLVDLTTGEILRKKCPDELVRGYLGGRGLSAYLLLRHLSRTVAPLDPENILVFAAGLLGGTRMVTSGRLHVGARSPLTGLIGISNGGGSFAAELKACGILALVVTGRAERPVLIDIKGDRIAVEDATDLWGMKTGEAREAIKGMAGDPQAKVILIGPAGERLSNLGCIMTDVGHAAGRTGMGAVMGSKNLKAIVARRAGRESRAVPEAAAEAVKRYVAKLKALPSWEMWSTTGSSTWLTWTDEMGASGAKNYSQVTFEGVRTACGSNYKD
ncbi:MAG: aldehyde ferredoxin oxidoreductase N-terminal domain-containing protein, partial [Thermacetogeniaceae bacterium]